MKNHKVHRVAAILISGCVICYTADAQQSSTLARMNSLIALEQYEQAYVVGKDNLETPEETLEGDPEFDLLFGIAAIEAGYPNESVFAFERVITQSTSAGDRDRARIELARAYFLTNNLTASENLFNQVLDSNPPQNVQNNIQAFLNLIQSRRQNQRATIKWSVATNVGTDSNINGATSSGTIDIPGFGLPIELNPDGQKTEDDFSDTTLTFSYSKPFTRDRFLSVLLSLNHRDNMTTDQFDLDTLRGEISYNYGNRKNRFKHGIQFSQVELDHIDFQNAVGINSSWQHAGNNGWYQSISAAAIAIRYDTNAVSPQNDLRDVNQFLLTASISKLGATFSNTFTIYYGDEDAQQSPGEQNGRSFQGVAHSLLWHLNSKHTPYLRVSYQQAEHDALHNVFPTTRDDSILTGSTGWIWQYSTKLSLTSDMVYTDADSNIPLFTYTRFKFQAGLRYQF